jgi:hypothetical protein
MLWEEKLQARQFTLETFFKEKADISLKNTPLSDPS